MDFLTGPLRNTVRRWVIGIDAGVRRFILFAFMVLADGSRILAATKTGPLYVDPMYVDPTSCAVGGVAIDGSVRDFETIWGPPDRMNRLSASRLVRYEGYDKYGVVIFGRADKITGILANVSDRNVSILHKDDDLHGLASKLGEPDELADAGESLRKVYYFNQKCCIAIDVSGSSVIAVWMLSYALQPKDGLTSYKTLEACSAGRTRHGR